MSSCVFKFILLRPDQSASQSASKIVAMLLAKIRLQREDDEVDVALYVPILKILMLYPEKLKYNVSTILVQTSVSFCSNPQLDRGGLVL